MGAALSWHLQPLWRCLTVLPGLGWQPYLVLEVPSVSVSVSLSVSPSQTVVEMVAGGDKVSETHTSSPGSWLLLSVPGVLGFRMTSDTVTGSKTRFTFQSSVETLRWNVTETKALLPRLLKQQQQISSHTCIPAPVTTQHTQQQGGECCEQEKIRGQRQMPSPHSSFSGSCCSLHLTTQYSAQPQLDAVRDGTILVRVGVEEGGMVTGWVGSLAVSAGGQQGSVSP